MFGYLSETRNCRANMMTSDPGNPSCASRYSVSCPVGGQKISHIQFVLRKRFQVLMEKTQDKIMQTFIVSGTDKIIYGR